MARVRLPLDATRWHRYAAAWDAQTVQFFIDDELVRTVPQSLTYPMQLMVDLFEFPASPVRDPADYPKVGDVREVLGFRHRRRQKQKRIRCTHSSAGSSLDGPRTKSTKLSAG